MKKKGKKKAKKGKKKDGGKGKMVDIYMHLVFFVSDSVYSTSKVFVV